MNTNERYELNKNLAQMLKGGVIMDVTTPEQAKIAELGVKNGWMLWPVRTAVSGKQFTPGGGVELCAILGKEDTLSRMHTAIERLSAAAQ